MGDEQKHSPDYDSNFMIKGKFRAGTQNIYGLMLLQFTYGGDIVASNIISTSYSDISNMQMDASWAVFEDEIIKYKWKGSYNSAMTSSLQSQFEKLRQDTSYRSQVFGYVSVRDIAGVNASLYDLINRVIHDKQLVLDTQIEVASPESILEVKRNRQTQSENREKDENPLPASTGYNLEKGAMIIPASLILSPVKGKPLFDLRIGDKILIKINPSTQTAIQFTDIYQLRIDNRIKPVPAEVVDIKAESKSSPVEILCKLDNTYFAKCVEEERQVKLRIYDPRIDGYINFEAKKSVGTSKPAATSDSGISSSMIALGATILFLFVVFILIIYILL